MTFRPFLHLVVSLMVVLTARAAFAAPRDAATLKKIDEALNVHYLAASYDKAEATLQKAIKACGAKFCSPEVLGKAYVAIGVVRGNGKQDIAGARAAFESARGADPKATLDAALVTPAVLKEFYKVMGREMPADVAKGAGSGDDDKSKKTRLAPAGNLRCSPASGYEVLTAQPIAVLCEPLEGVVRAELYYRSEDETKYTAILMSVQDGTLRATIPCDRLTKPGKLKVYILAQDFNKETIDTFGTLKSPAHFRIVKETKEATPSFPGEDPPPRCSELLNASGGLGQSCTADSRCRKGFYCSEGVCAVAPKCETLEDCVSNRQCLEGVCQMEESYAEPPPEPETEPNRFMFGLHFGADLWLAPKVNQVCGQQQILSGNFNCYNAGEDKIYVSRTDGLNTAVKMVDDGGGGNVASGIRLATVRLMASGEYVFTPHLSVGGRIGWAFGEGPPTIHFNNGKPVQRPRWYAPIHIEARGTYWLRSLGKKGIHPYVHLGLGVAEVDAKVPINGKYSPPPSSVQQTRKLDAWRKMGMMFVTGGLGGLYTFDRHHGLQLNINVMYLFPAKGTVIEPSLGYVFGF
ncbi:MAG TPA: EB domain-containing protein [Polyangiaceae bacterium]|nr:EB domain-containing protein [Polyangiaceae bacterium]